MKTEFRGFCRPTSNYFRMPNEWTDITREIKSLAVLKLVEYVLRHTWGYVGEEDRPKRISIEEFANGRKRKNGTRIDKGTGLSVGAISAGLKAAVESGYLVMVVDDSDGGRVKRFFRLVLQKDGEFTPSDSEPRPSQLGSESERVGSESERVGSESERVGSEFEPASSQFGGRSWKDNHRKDNQERQEGNASRRPSSNGGSKLFDEGRARRTKKDPHFDDFDRRAARRLKKIVVENNETSLLNVKEQTIARQILRLRKEVGATEEEIREWVNWLRSNYVEEDVAKFRRTRDFFDHFARHRDAIRRRKNDASSNGKKLTRNNLYEEGNVGPGGIPRIELDSDGNRYDGRTMYRLRKKILERCGRGLPSQEQVDGVLKEFFDMSPGAVPAALVGRVG